MAGFTEPRKLFESNRTSAKENKATPDSQVEFGVAYFRSEIFLLTPYPLSRYGEGETLLE